MRFLVDENAGRRLNELLKHSGHDSVFSGDILRGADDEAVLSRSEKEKRVLITDDKDFGELIFRLNRPSSGVVLFRTRTDPVERLELLERVLKKVDLENSFTTIGEGRFKTRNLSR